MDPPEAYAPPGWDRMPPADLHPFLRSLSEEHARLTEALSAVEDAIGSAKENGFTQETDHALMYFLQVFDRDFIPHSREEETTLFPLLSERLIADGEHSKGKTVTTAVDVMRDEHLKAVQLAAVVLNFVRVGLCLPDERSRRTVIDAALRETTNLVELLRLHIFREDNIVFPSTQRLISAREMDAMRSANQSAARE